MSFSWISQVASLHEDMNESEDTPMMWGWGYGFNWLNMTLMMLGSTLWIVLLIVIVLAVIRWQKNRAVSPPQPIQALPGSGPTAREILSQRYARGEIDATTFEQMRERLEATKTVYQRNSAEVLRPSGEGLFDGSTRAI